MELVRREVYSAELDDSAIVCSARYLAKPEDVRHLCHAMIEAAKQVPANATLTRHRIDDGNRMDSEEVQDITIPLPGDTLLAFEAWETYRKGHTVVSGTNILVENAVSGNHLSLSLYSNETLQGRLQGVEPEIRIAYEGPPPQSCDGKEVDPIPLAFQREDIQRLLLHFLCNLALRDAPALPPDC